MKNIFKFLFLSLSLLAVLQTYAQEKIEVSGLIGTNYAVLKNMRSYEVNHNWYPGLISGVNFTYQLKSKIALETGLYYDNIRMGHYYYPNAILNPDGSYKDKGSRESYSKSFKYINLPLNLLYNIKDNIGVFGGFGYRFATGTKAYSVLDVKDNEPFANIGVFYKIEGIKLKLGYSKGLKEGSLGRFDGDRNRTVTFSASYPLFSK